MSNDVTKPKKGDLLRIGRYLLELVDPKSYYIRLSAGDDVWPMWVKVKGYPIETPIRVYPEWYNSSDDNPELDGDIFAHHPLLASFSKMYGVDNNQWVISHGVTGMRLFPRLHQQYRRDTKYPTIRDVLYALQEQIKIGNISQELVDNSLVVYVIQDQIVSPRYLRVK